MSRCPKRIGTRRLANMHVMTAALAVFIAPPAWAIHKCTDAAGRVTYQEQPCPAASAGKEIRTWTGGPGGGGADRSVEPDFDLAGPPAAAPLLAIYRRWIDAERLAFSTSRIALSTPAGALQQLRREAEGTPVEACMAEAKSTLADLIGKSADAVLQFMAKEEITAMAYKIAYRPQLVPAFEQAVKSSKCP